MKIILELDIEHTTASQEALPLIKAISDIDGVKCEVKIDGTKCTVMNWSVKFT